MANFGLLLIQLIGILEVKEKSMPQTMTLDEKLAIGCKAAELRKAGDDEGSMLLMKTVPMPPYIAKVIKEKVGLDILLETGWNFSEVEAEFGSEWLRK